MVLNFFLLVITFLLISCTDIQRDNPTDPDGVNFIGSGYAPKGNDIAKYRTKQIGTQVWMAENLDYDVSSSKCYNDNAAACMKYGRIYDWATAMNLQSSCNSTSCVSQIGAKHRGICPSGWHIPSDADWNELINYVESSNGCRTTCAARYLKATDDWNSNGNGTDNYGFSALPSGYGYSVGSFYSVGDYGYWWSASEYDSNYAYSRYMGYSREGVSYRGDSKNYLYSVRCVQD